MLGALLSRSPSGFSGVGVIEEVGASARTLLAHFTSGIKAGQRVVGVLWPAAEGQGQVL